MSKRPLGLYSVCSFLLFVMPSSAAFATTGNPWQGPYLGVYTGASYGNDQVSTNVGGVGPDTSYFQSAADANAVSNAGTFTTHPTEFLAGVRAGEDWSSKQMVYGLVMDYSSLPFSASESVSNVTYPASSYQYNESTSMSVNWLFTLRARVGFASMLHNMPSLFYLTAGPALTQIKVSNNFSDNFMSGTGGSSNSAYQLGWAAGAGLELFSFKHLSVDIEYLYVDMPSVSTTSTIYNTSGGGGIPIQSLSNSFSSSGKFSGNLFKIGLNYRF